MKKTDRTGRRKWWAPEIFYEEMRTGLEEERGELIGFSMEKDGQD